MWCVIGVEMTAGGECELDTFGRSQDPRRAGARILDTAEGVLIALRGCSLNQAFVEIVQTAKAHNVSTLSLADALVALTQNHGPRTGRTPHWSPPAPHGATFSTRPGRVAARDVAAKTTVLPALRTGRCRRRGRRRVSAR